MAKEKIKRQRRVQSWITGVPTYEELENKVLVLSQILLAHMEAGEITLVEDKSLPAYTGLTLPADSTDLLQERAFDMGYRRGFHQGFGEINRIADETTNIVIPKSIAHIMAREDMRGIIGRIDEQAQMFGTGARHEAIVRRLKILKQSLAESATKYENTGFDVIKMLPDSALVEQQIGIWKTEVSAVIDAVNKILSTNPERKPKAFSEALKELQERYAKLPANAEFEKVLDDALKRQSSGADSKTRLIVIEMDKRIQKAKKAHHKLIRVDAAEQALIELKIDDVDIDTAVRYYDRWKNNIPVWLNLKKDT